MTRTAEEPRRCIAVLVGVDRYEDPEIRDLDFAESDCIELYGFLKHRVRYDKVEILRGSGLSSQAVLDAARKAARSLSPGDLFLFFFAGHGHLVKDRLALVLARARLARLDHLQEVVTVDLLKRETEVAGVDRAFLVDSCRGDLLRTRGGRSEGFRGQQSLRGIVAGHRDPGSSFAMLCACADGQQAVESPQLGNGLFTAALLGVFEEAATTGEGLDLSDALERRVVVHMNRLAGESGITSRQTPWITRAGSPPLIIPPGLVRPAPAPRRSAKASPGRGERPLRETCPSCGAANEARARFCEACATPLKADCPSCGGEIRPGVAHCIHCGAATSPGEEPWRQGGHAYGEEDIGLYERVLSLPDWRLPDPARNEQGILEAVHEKTGLTFVLVPSGSFRMGSEEGEEGRFRDESPVRTVRMPAFLLSKTECTQKAWARIGGDDEREWKRRLALPMEGVNWEDVKSWCGKAGLRLPSEAEWEYACRAGSTSRWCFGETDSQLRQYAWYDENSDSRTHPVGEKRPNAWGLFDMHGNVWEWCEDRWHDSYEGAPTDESAWTTGSTSLRVGRGGSRSNSARNCRSAYRRRDVPGIRSGNLGFRPAFSGS